MSAHDDRRRSDEQFDEYARAAGASLRRPAPADGLHHVQAIRRRQRIARAATGGAAVALLAVAGTVLVLRDGDDADISTAPDTTGATATSVVPEPAPTTVPVVPPPPAPTGPTTTVATTVVPPGTAPADSVPVGGGATPAAGTPLSDPAQAWIDAQAADGLTMAQLTRGEGTAAVLIAAWHPTEARSASVVMLPDGRVIATPDGMTAQPFAFDMYAIGDQPVLIGDTDGTVVLRRLDPATGEWATGPDLGLGAIQTESNVLNPLQVLVVDGSLVVGVNSYVSGADGAISPAPERRGAVVHPDLSVTPIAAPPDGVPMTWSSTAGTKALLLFAPNGGSENAAPIGGRWAYDVDSGTWSPITDPEWFSCGDACDWTGPFEFGDLQLAVTTDRGVLVRIPDGTIGLYDAGADRWTRLDDAPFELASPRALVMGDQVLVAPMRGFPGTEYGTVGVVDLTTGAWTTSTITFPSDVQALIDTWVDASWDIRTDGTTVMLTPSTAQRGTSRDPLAAYDPAGRTWSAPTAADIETWRRYPTIFGAEGF